MSLRGVSLTLLTFFFISLPLTAWSKPSAWARFKRKYSVYNSLQGGLEYDTNVFKTFGNSQSGALTRLLLKSRGKVPLGSSGAIGWRYQGGGKIFFTKSEQNLIIQYLQIPLQWKLSRNIWVSFRPDIKYQNENNAVDESIPPWDLNEDYWTTTSFLNVRFFLPAAFTVEPYGEFSYLKFKPQADYSYFRQRGGVVAGRKFGDLFSIGTEYRYGRQQFQNSTREDQENSVSAFFQLHGVPFVSARYTYQDGDSTDDVFSFTNHRVNVLFSMPLLSSQTKNEEGEETSKPLASFHFMGTLQLKNYPAVFASTEEGQRVLLTGAEDDNFNSILVKLTIHPSVYWAIEAKFTRYSNELSEREEKFSRSLFYGGVRYSF